MQLRDKTSRTTAAIHENFIDEVQGKAEKKEREIWMNALEASLDELNKEQKISIALFYLQKKSYAEISASTGFTLMEVKAIFKTAKEISEF